MNFPSPFDLGQTTYGLSAQVWRGFEPQAAILNPSYGFYHLERFKEPVARLTTTQAGSAGTSTYLGSVDGFGTVLEIDSASSTNTQGANVQDKSLLLNAKNGMVVCFETMLRAHDIATSPEFYAGLFDVQTAIIASGALETGSGAYCAGFSSVTTDKLVLASASNGATPSSSGTVHTLVDADVTTDGTEWVRLGVRAIVGETLEFYVNGVKAATSLAASLFPIGAAICPSFVCQSNGTTDPLLHVAWYAFGYKSSK